MSYLAIFILEVYAYLVVAVTLKNLGPAMLVYPKMAQSTGGYAAPQRCCEKLEFFYRPRGGRSRDRILNPVGLRVN